MATREELEEKYDDCQETPDYVAVALEAFKDLDDKDWAVELYEEGADWAATAQDFLALSTGAKVILGDAEKAAEYFDQAKSACRDAGEMTDLAVASAGAGDTDGAREMFAAAAEKAAKAAEFLGLSNRAAADLAKLSDVKMLMGRSCHEALFDRSEQCTGCPLAAKDEPAEFDDGRTGRLIDGRDPADYARAVREILDDDDRRAAMSAASVERARRYTWSFAAARLRRLYGDLTVRERVMCR